MNVLLLLLVLLQNSPTEGPITDAIERRLTQRIEGITSGLQGILDRNNEGLFAQLVEARRERHSLIERLSEARIERIGLIQRVRDLSESMQKWTPLANLADRLLNLGWKLLLLVIGFFVLIELARALTVWMLSRIVKSFLPKVEE